MSPTPNSWTVPVAWGCLEGRALTYPAVSAYIAEMVEMLKAVVSLLWESGCMGSRSKPLAPSQGYHQALLQPEEGSRDSHLGSFLTFSPNPDQADSGRSALVFSIFPKHSRYGAGSFFSSLPVALAPASLALCEENYSLWASVSQPMLID